MKINEIYEKAKDIKGIEARRVTISGVAQIEIKKGWIIQYLNEAIPDSKIESILTKLQE